MKKKSIEYIIDKIIGSGNEKLCDEVDCKDPGIYSAPKSPNSNEKYSFCLYHVKQYNKRWNFFAGKSQSQIYEYQKNDFFLGRPTRPFSKGISSKIRFEFEYSFNKEKIKFTKNKREKSSAKNVSLSKEIQTSIEIFKLNNDFNENILKKRYKELVKIYHPDLNKNYLNKERKIKQINKAYNILLRFLKS
tara:strand:+ start:276 stop:845 length:570 start_codon:yes stop_codon:yes gene_type:complete